MNKNLVKVIALTLAINSISSVMPSTFNINTSKVMAATSIEGIESLYVCRGEGSSSMTLYKDSDFKNSTKFKNSINKYYANLPENTGKFNIDVDTEEGYSVKITKDGDEYDSKDVLSVSKGSSANVKVKIYDEDDSLVNTITIKVTRDGEDSSDSDDDYEDNYDDIYLDDLNVKSKEENINFDFVRNKAKFSLTVGQKVDKVTIVAKPNSDDDKVRISGTRVKEDDDYEMDVNLNFGNNSIKVTVENEDDEIREYIINIKREGNTSSNTSTIIDGKIMSSGMDIADSSFYDYDLSNSSYVEDASKTSNEKNKWVKKGLNWQYFDSNGNALRNEWFKDSDGKWYYFQTNAYMTTGWRFIDGTWYYFDNAGYMLSNKWLKDVNGKWYYFTRSGDMAKNTVIDGYKVNARGQMIEE